MNADTPEKQNHGWAGPALFGEAPLGGGRTFTYNASLLAGVSAQAPDLTVRFQLEYEFF